MFFHAGNVVHSCAAPDILCFGVAPHMMQRTPLDQPMTLFLSTYANKVDRKGRVSVPAPFRAALAGQAYPGIVLFRSSTQSCLEGFAFSTMEELGRRLDHFDLFSSAQDDLATAIFGEAMQLPFDAEGRIVIPESLIAHAAIDEQAVFVGLGRKFQIWNLAAFEKRREEARAQVRDKNLTLPRLVEDAA